MPTGIPSQINYLHLSPFLRICYKGRLWVNYRKILPVWMQIEALSGRKFIKRRKMLLIDAPQQAWLIFQSTFPPSQAGWFCIALKYISVHCLPTLLLHFFICSKNISNVYQPHNQIPKWPCSQNSILTHGRSIIYKCMQFTTLIGNNNDHSKDYMCLGFVAKLQYHILPHKFHTCGCYFHCTDEKNETREN